MWDLMFSSCCCFHPVFAIVFIWNDRNVMQRKWCGAVEELSLDLYMAQSDLIHPPTSIRLNLAKMWAVIWTEDLDRTGYFSDFEQFISELCAYIDQFQYTFSIPLIAVYYLCLKIETDTTDKWAVLKLVRVCTSFRRFFPQLETVCKQPMLQFVTIALPTVDTNNLWQSITG